MQQKHENIYSNMPNYALFTSTTCKIYQMIRYSFVKKSHKSYRFSKYALFLKHRCIKFLALIITNKISILSLLRRSTNSHRTQRDAKLQKIIMLMAIRIIKKPANSHYPNHSSSLIFSHVDEKLSHNYYTSTHSQEEFSHP